MTDRPRSILITGCSSGIGYHTAHALKARGYRVFATARKPEDVERLKSEGLESLQLDLDDTDSIHNAVADILAATGGTLDALFNNGGYGQPGAVEDLSRAMLRAQFETNVFGTLELTNAVIPVMRKQGHGRIVQNSSVLGFAAMPFRGAYIASKFALEGLYDTLRLELANTGIQVALIEPGPIVSRFRANAYAVYQRSIDVEHSAFRETYRAMERRLTKEGPAALLRDVPDLSVRDAEAPAADARTGLGVATGVGRGQPLRIGRTLGRPDYWSLPNRATPVGAAYGREPAAAALFAAKGRSYKTCLAITKFQ